MGIKIRVVKISSSHCKISINILYASFMYAVRRKVGNAALPVVVHRLLALEYCHAGAWECTSRPGLRLDIVPVHGKEFRHCNR